jgi:hypothetical protein
VTRTLPKGIDSSLDRCTASYNFAYGTRAEALGSDSMYGISARCDFVARTPGLAHVTRVSKRGRSEQAIASQCPRAIAPPQRGQAVGQRECGGNPRAGCNGCLGSGCPKLELCNGTWTPRTVSNQLHDGRKREVRRQLDAVGARSQRNAAEKARRIAKHYVRTREPGPQLEHERGALTRHAV